MIFFVRICRIYINEAINDWRSPSSQIQKDTENEQLSTFSVDSDCSGHTEINAAVVNKEAEDQTCAYLLSNSSSSNGEELDSCDDSSWNDSSSDETDKDSFLSDDGIDCANVFTKSIYKGSNLSVGASCILIMQFSWKYKLLWEDQLKSFHTSSVYPWKWLLKVTF